MASRRDDPKVAYEVFKSNISDIKARATVKLPILADKLREKKIISIDEKDEAVDDYTGKPEAVRRGKLIDKVQESLKDDIGEAFEIFLGILRAEDTHKCDKLAKELEEKYDSKLDQHSTTIIFTNTFCRNCWSPRSYLFPTPVFHIFLNSGWCAKLVLQSTAFHAYNFSLCTEINDSGRVLDTLKKHNFTTAGWRTLCGRLGLSYDVMSTIEDENRKVERRLEEGISCWLKGNIIEGYKKPSWGVLVEALRGMGENAVAEGIKEEKMWQKA